VCHGDYLWIRFLTSPLSTISNLTPTGIENASPLLISLSLQAVTKIVGTHCADVSSTDRWSRETHAQTKDLIASCRNGIAPLVQHADLDVQERAGELDGLLQFIAADLASHQPPTRIAPPIAMDKIPGVEGGFETDAGPSNTGKAEHDEPAYPKSLFLLQPLFTSHELNAVSEQAQDAVRVPDGLDLEKDLVPGGGWTGNEIEVLESSADELEKEADKLGQGGGAGMDELRRVIREGQKKGKRREGETPEERKERQAVSRSLLTVLKEQNHPCRKKILMNSGDEPVKNASVAIRTISVAARIAMWTRYPSSCWTTQKWDRHRPKRDRAMSGPKSAQSN
jgi:AP-3 complex subunit delta-1